MRYFLLFLALLIVTVVSIAGFRGAKSEKPPLMVFPDMDYQPRYNPQASNNFFQDGMNDRPVPGGTVLRGYGWDMKPVFSADFVHAPSRNPALFSGKAPDGSFYRGYPVPVDNRLMALGREKFNIYCAVCHGAVGDGNGITKQYGMLATPTYHQDRLRVMPEGEIFNVITNGRNTMNPYGDKLQPEERWAVIAYLRALQLSQNAKVTDVPADQRAKLGL